MRAIAVVMLSLVDVGEATGVLTAAVGVMLLVVAVVEMMRLIVAAVGVTLLVAVALTLDDGTGVPDAIGVSGTVDGALAPEPLFTATA